MKTLAVFLCLALIGCATVGKESKVAPPPSEKTKYVYIEESYLDSIIGVFSQAIKERPEFGGYYYNRAIAYFYKKAYDKSWEDVYKAQSLGFVFDERFINKLRRAYRRDKQKVL